MTVRERNVRVVLLAAQRRGVTNPLATRFGTSHKCLIPLLGRPLIHHVLETLAGHERVAEIVVSVEEELFGAIASAGATVARSAPIRTVAAADNLTDSVVACVEGHDGPVLITTADHALLHHRSVDTVLDALNRADVAVGMARECAVRRAHDQGQRRFYQFRDSGYSNCNLYALASPSGLRAAEVFRGGGQFARSAGRIVSAFGLLNLLLLRFRLFTLQGAMHRISRRLGITIVAAEIDDGTQAIDVDNDRTYRVVEELLRRRMANPTFEHTAAA